MRREPRGEMQRRVFLAWLFVQAKCGRPARIHRQRRKNKGEKMGEEEKVTESEQQTEEQLHRLSKTITI